MGKVCDQCLKIHQWASLNLRRCVHRTQGTQILNTSHPAIHNISLQHLDSPRLIHPKTQHGNQTCQSVRQRRYPKQHCLGGGGLSTSDCPHGEDDSTDRRAAFSRAQHSFDRLEQRPNPASVSLEWRPSTSPPPPTPSPSSFT